VEGGEGGRDSQERSFELIFGIRVFQACGIYSSVANGELQLRE
jgi:hypothetical protein